MIPLHPGPGSRIACDADFAFHPVANLHFCAADAAVIPFHVSLRRDAGLVVVNRRDRQGWRREIGFAHAFRGSMARVELLFGAAGVVLRVDGRRIGRFDALPRPARGGRLFLRRGFPGLGQITGLVTEGEVPPASLRISQGRPPRLAARIAGTARLGLGARLELLAPGQDAVTLPDGMPLALAGGQAVLPGRIWRDIPPGGAFAPGPGLAFGRADLCNWLTRVVAGEAAEFDDLLALQAIEHARFAGVLADLPPETVAGLARLAARFGLTGFLGAPAAVVAELPADPLAALDPLLARLMARWRADPGLDPADLLADLLADLPPDLPAPLAEALFLRLAEGFCLRGGFVALAKAAWGRVSLPEELPQPPEDRWTASARLPFLMAAGRIALLPDLLWQLAAQRDGWLVTPALATAVTLALEDPALEGALRSRITDAWIGLIEAEAGSYHGRAPCVALVGVTLRLLAQAALLPAEAGRALRDAALRCHGLDPGFWAGLPAAADDPALAEARAAFATLGDPLADRAAQAAALALFGWYRNPDVARFRRILFGPAGVALAPGAVPDLAGLRSAGDPGAALLRQALFPDAALALPGDPALAALAARAVAPAWNGVAEPVLAGLQRDLARRLMAKDPPDPGAVAPALAALATQAAQWLGFALALQLLARLGGGGGAEALAGRLETLFHALTPGEQALCRMAPGVAIAATRAGEDPASRRLLALLAPGAVPAPVLPPGASALQDTLVVVYSCRANLDSRVAAMRAGWLGDLAAYGVPYVVVTGGAAPGQAAQSGDVVSLDCPDDYEGLPQKTLALIAWVRDRTPFSRLLKVDDDCFVDVVALFGSLQTLKSDYAGRVLTRVRGQMDRTWHMARAATPRGRHEIDKSPEPSAYADGGSGWLLSRRAMAAALAEAATPAGQQLIAVSFMEDKLLGDLLARRGIRPRGEGWRVAVERKSGQLLLPHWENGPRPFAGAGIAVAHLDGHAEQPAARAGAQAPWPARGRLWPSWQEVRFGAGSNCLTLVSGADRLRRAAAAPLAVVACLRNEMAMLPQFLAHYRRIGVEGFLVADNLSDDGSADYLAQQSDVALFSVDTPYAQSHYGTAWQEALLAGFRPGRWTLLADADELLVWDASAGGDLPALLREAEFRDADAVRLFMLDMYPQGPLAGADFVAAPPFQQAGCADRSPFLTTSGARGPFSDQPTWTSGLRHRLLPGSRPELFVAQKLALLRYRPWMRLTAGLHYVSGTRLAARDLVFGHFKYTAAFHAKVQAEVARRQHFNDAEEYRRYQALLAEGRDVLYDPAHSGHWAESGFVRSLFATGRPPAGQE